MHENKNETEMLHDNTIREYFYLYTIILRIYLCKFSCRYYCYYYYRMVTRTLTHNNIIKREKNTKKLE